MSKRVVPSQRELGVVGGAIRLALACMVLGLGGTFAWQPLALHAQSQPARDTPAQTQRGAATARPTGRIAGRVVTADTGRPVRRARVLLNASEVPGGRGVLTDDDGLFEFTELPAGRYTIGVSKSGFITISYGQRRPLQPGTPLQLADAEQLRGIEFRLPRGSVIAGQVLDEAGDPLPGANIRVLAYRYAQGQRQLVPVGSAQTDDRGEYRVWGLNPGEYFVSATARNFTFNGGGGPGGFGGRGGRGGGPGGPPAPGAFGSGAVGTATPGVASPPATPSSAGEPEQTGYAPTYYPGVDTVAQARSVNVALGAEAADISFGILLVRTTRITGRVVASDGTPVSTGDIVLALEGQGGPGRPGPGAGFGSRINWDGNFTINNVPPGRYLLRARGDDWETPQFALVPLTVTGGEVSGVNVVLQPGATITGTAVFQRSQALTPDPTQFRVAAPSVEGTTLGRQPQARIDDKGTFTLEGVSVGSHWLRTQTPRGWIVRSIVADGRDVTDTPIELRSSQRLSNVTVTFTDKLGEISGTVKDSKGAPITEYTVLVFPADTALWYPQSRFIMTARPDQTGRYQIRGLPPGQYLVAAVDPAEANEWYEPAFLDQQRPNATSLTLGDGDIKTQNLTLGR